MRALLGEAADEARVGIAVYDETGKYLAANKATCALLGYDLDELFELPPPKITPGRRGTDSGTARLRRKDGSTVGGRYVAARTTIAHLEYTISFFEPRR